MFFKEEIMKNSNISSGMSFDFSKYQKNAAKPDNLEKN